MLPPSGKKWVVKDLTGQTFGRLTVLERHPQNHSHGNARWIVRCSCGTVKVVRSCHLIRGTTITCGGKCKDKQKDIATRTRSRSVFVSHMATRYRKHAERRGIRWNLTDEQVDRLLSGNCFYCGIEPRFKNRGRGNISFYLYNGIDRLANRLGYFEENCVSCCGDCNVAKADRSLHDFMKWIERLRSHSNAE